jgi:hypothetical protein
MKTYQIGDHFPQSSALVEVIIKHGWNLYDVSEAPAGKELPWDDLHRKSPTNTFVIGNNYFLIPQPSDGETLESAYARNTTSRPSIHVERPEEDRWLSIELSTAPPYAFFSRLIFDEEFLVATTPSVDKQVKRDFLVISYEDIIETFRSHYRVLSKEEFDKAVGDAASFGIKTY